MTAQDDDKTGNDGPDDEWAEFRDGEREPIGIDELKRLDLPSLPEGISLTVLDNYFPEVTIWREGASHVCEIQEHLYTKYWEHKFGS